MTLRHLFYLLISDGLLENAPKEYDRLSDWIVDGRMEGAVPFEAIVDGIRHSIKPASWSGLEDFGETVRNAYRKDLWQRQRDYVEFWFEKDAIIGVIEDLARKYDIKIRPLRGQSSLTFLHDAAWELARIQKPTFIYYFGDHDPSGYSIEDSACERLQQLLKLLESNKHVFNCNPYIKYWTTALPTSEELEENAAKYPHFVNWTRLGFLKEDFETEFDFEDGSQRRVLRLKAKRDSNYKKFIGRFASEDAAELDSLPMAEIRNRVEQTILAHIDTSEWEALQKIESLERESFAAAMASFGQTP